MRRNISRSAYLEVDGVDAIFEVMICCDLLDVANSMQLTVDIIWRSQFGHGFCNTLLVDKMEMSPNRSP